MTAATLLRFAFFIVIGVVAYFFWRDVGAPRDRDVAARSSRVFYAAVALFVVDVGWWVVIGIERPRRPRGVRRRRDLRLRRRHDVARAALGSLTAIPSRRSSASRSGMCWPTKIGVSRSV